MQFSPNTVFCNLQIEDYCFVVKSAQSQHQKFQICLTQKKFRDVSYDMILFFFFFEVV
jgi:hypothetical protein